jgi:2-C-methyl-D-erythritol 4-phosphate cytidylyltransferase
MKVEVIMPTAGVGERLKNTSPKPLVELNGKPLFIYPLEVFEAAKSVDSVVIVASQELVDVFYDLVQQYSLAKVKIVVVGGKTRNESVFNGLKNVDDDTDVVIVHDGARPFITEDLINSAVNLCKEEEAVIAAVKVKSTIKKVNSDSYVEETLDRNTLWEIQTPQVFKKDVLISAHKKKLDVPVTDDAMLVESLGIKVKILESSYKNIKITTKEDLEIAKVFLS